MVFSRCVRRTMFGADFPVWQTCLSFNDKFWSSKLLPILFGAKFSQKNFLFKGVNFSIHGTGIVRPDSLQPIGCATSSSVVCKHFICFGSFQNFLMSSNCFFSFFGLLCWRKTSRMAWLSGHRSVCVYVYVCKFGSTKKYSGSKNIPDKK